MEYFYYINGLLGINITQDLTTTKILISQSSYFKNRLDKYNMSEYKPVSTVVEREI